MCLGEMSWEIDMVTGVQILGKAVCISPSANTLGKGMNPIILPPAVEMYERAILPHIVFTDSQQVELRCMIQDDPARKEQGKNKKLNKCLSGA